MFSVPGQPVMLPPQVPGFQPGVRFTPVMPPTSTNQLMPPSFAGPMVGALSMGVAPNSGMIRHPGLLPQQMMPLGGTAEMTKGINSKPTENVNPKPKRTTTRFSSITDVSVALSSNTDSSITSLESIANIPTPGVVQGMPTPLMSVNGNFRPPVPQGLPEKMSEDQGSDMNVMPPVSTSVPLLTHPPMQDNSGMVRGEMRPPLRFPGMRFNAPRMPRLMSPRPLHPPMRMMGRRPPFHGEDMMRPERPWMDQEMFTPRPAHPDFNGEDRFDPDYPPGHRMFMDREHFHGGPPPSDWHEPFDRYNDRPPYDRWNDERR